MATFELSQDEVDALAVALRSYLGDLQDEIGHTDDYDYRQSLQQRRDHLEAILARLAPNS
jgi:hypothetical protein